MQFVGSVARSAPLALRLTVIHRYGTHYSTPGYVLFYLVRQKPEHMLRMQSGKFDSPDRMFNDISATWSSVLSNPADLKELIPEFYDPKTRGTFLVNGDKLRLGTRADGSQVRGCRRWMCCVCARVCAPCDRAAWLSGLGVAAVWCCVLLT